MSEQAGETAPPAEDPDARAAVRQVQDGQGDAAPPTGVVTDELKDASSPDS